MDCAEAAGCRPVKTRDPLLRQGAASIYIPLLACKTRKRTVVTVPGGIGKTPDNESPQRVKVVLDCTEVVEPRRVATRDEMLAAADRVFTRRGRKPTRDG